MKIKMAYTYKKDKTKDKKKKSYKRSYRTKGLMR